MKLFYNDSTLNALKIIINQLYINRYIIFFIYIFFSLKDAVVTLTYYFKI